jgi:hypothetical protein
MNDQTQDPPRSLAMITTGNQPLAIIPTTVDQVYRIAQMAKMSGAVKSVEQGCMIVMHGLELGLPPMAALERITIIKGRRCIWGDAVPGLPIAKGLVKDWEEKIVGEGDNMKAVCTVWRRGKEKPVTVEFSVADAKAAGLWQTEAKVVRWSERDQKEIELPNDSPWYRFQKRMLKMRARVAWRDAFPEVFVGLHIAEEISDDPIMKDVTPAKETFRTVENPMADRPETTLQDPRNDGNEMSLPKEYQPGYVPGTRYWHHPESDSQWTTKGTDPAPELPGDGSLIEEVTEERYKNLLAGWNIKAVDAIDEGYRRNQEREEATGAATMDLHHKWVEEAFEQRITDVRKALLSIPGGGERAGVPIGSARGGPAGHVDTTDRMEAARVAEKQQPTQACTEPAHASKPLEATQEPPKAKTAPATALREEKPAQGGYYQDAMVTVTNAVDAAALNKWWRGERKARSEAGLSATELDTLTQSYNRKFMTLSGA